MALPCDDRLSAALPRGGSLAGTSAWVRHAEWRFPIPDCLSVGVPFGEVRFPGVQAALFTDYGRAWSFTAPQRGTLGSSGLGLRMPVAGALVVLPAPGLPRGLVLPQEPARASS